MRLKQCKICIMGRVETVEETAEETADTHFLWIRLWTDCGHPLSVHFLWEVVGIAGDHGGDREIVDTHFPPIFSLFFAVKLINGCLNTPASEL
jgi:hypothetical protein